MLSGTNLKYLDDLNRMGAEMGTLQRQLSSGFRVERPEDDPSAVGPIAQTR